MYLAKEFVKSPKQSNPTNDSTKAESKKNTILQGRGGFLGLVLQCFAPRCFRCFRAVEPLRPQGRIMRLRGS